MDHSRLPPIRSLILLSLAVALGAGWLTGATRAAEPASGAAPLTCILLSKEGKVDVARKGSPQFTPAPTNLVLNIGDRLRTGLRSRATLRWSDLSVVRVDELTSLELQPPDKAKAKPQLELKSGATYFLSREKPEEIQFRTPVASGAIRGTEFNLAVAENGRTVISLIDGEVLLAAAQVNETLRSGEQGTVDPGQPPKKAPLLDATNVIQWTLYYPSVVDPDELGLSTQEKETFAGALKAYREGDLLGALAAYPENRQPVSDAERGLQAALLLAAGQAAQAEASLKSLQNPSPASKAVREVIAAVKHETLSSLPEPGSGSEWLARSYYEQSRSKLPEALAAAIEATRKSPNFGAAHIRVGELEFGNGHTKEALEALNQGLKLSPRNAQGLALNGFVLAARGRTAEAMGFFDQAIAVDGGLGNGWLGRGLTKIRRGQARSGRDDLQVAATVEPLRALFRSYLGKAWSYTGDRRHAEQELALARQLDANDPTAWFYGALLAQQNNRPNEAVARLEKAKELNDNRSVFRSREQLEQDTSVRSANLASMYRDIGLFDRSVQEAAAAVNADYANASAHLFLSESYNSLRDPKLINLRYETPWYSELLVADLLGPANGGTYSPNVAYQEYTRFFEGDYFGLFSSTEYFSSGDWVQRGSQYGVFGNGQTSYSLDAFYRKENGQRPNNDLEQLDLSARIKHQLTEKDGLFLQVGYFSSDSGDVAQYYDQGSASKTVRVSEFQQPTLLVGYHHEWSPSSHTLALFGRFDDTLEIDEPSAGGLNWNRRAILLGGAYTNTYRNPGLFSLDYESELEAYSGELQHIFQLPKHTIVAGVRYQAGWSDTDARLTRDPGVGPSGITRVDTSADTSLDRFSIYAYEHWKILDNLRLSAGVSYDRLNYPDNIDVPPIQDGQNTKDQVSPKVGIVWDPLPDTRLRAAWTRSLGGVFFDQSVRLEPVQIAGFNQAFRSLVPESVVGLVPGTRFETWGAGWDQVYRPTRTYLTVEGQYLTSDATRTVGVLTNSSIGPIPPPVADSASSDREKIEYHERSLIVALNQLVGNDWAFGARYKLTDADRDGGFRGQLRGLNGTAGLNQDVEATLHQLDLFTAYTHRCGFFARFDAVWSRQSNRDYAPDIPGDDFWQFHIIAGYRFWQRRAEARVGLLNLTDTDYRLNPLTLYSELPRERTFTAGFKFYF
jgi:tetratricopeptide (TPR) repeat protein